MTTSIAQRTVRVSDLGYNAQDYLRTIARNLRLEGKSATEVAAELNAWADGYRAWSNGAKAGVPASGAGQDGWAYARGEAAYARCMNEEPAA